MSAERRIRVQRLLVANGAPAPPGHGAAREVGCRIVSDIRSLLDIDWDGPASRAARRRPLRVSGYLGAVSNLLLIRTNRSFAGTSTRVSEGTRTPDRLDHNQELYQLSYAHRAALNLAPRAPPTGERVVRRASGGHAVVRVEEAQEAGRGAAQARDDRGRLGDVDIEADARPGAHAADARDRRAWARSWRVRRRGFLDPGRHSPSLERSRLRWLPCLSAWSPSMVSHRNARMIEGVRVPKLACSHEATTVARVARSLDIGA